MSKRFVFPVGGKTTIGGPFGSFRADTGAHQGNDLFADFGTPVVAVADGTIENVGSLPISGNRLWVYADGGDQFFYAHLASFAPAAVNGRHVEAGTILGYIGNTGDAEPTPPHLHFEIHPNGGDAVDPEPVPGRLAEARRRRPGRHRRAPRRARRGPRLHRRRMSEPEDAPKPTLVERMRAQREIHANRPLYLRVLIVVAGFTLLFAGLAMLVLPGPALAVIPIALAILSLEFAWAGRALETALEKAEKAKQIGQGDLAAPSGSWSPSRSSSAVDRRDRRLDPVGDPDRPVHLAEQRRGCPVRRRSGLAVAVEREAEVVRAPRSRRPSRGSARSRSSSGPKRGKPITPTSASSGLGPQRRQLARRARAGRAGRS